MIRSIFLLSIPALLAFAAAPARGGEFAERLFGGIPGLSSARTAATPDCEVCQTGAYPDGMVACDQNSDVFRVPECWGSHCRCLRRFWFRLEQSKKCLLHRAYRPDCHPTWGYYPTCWRRFPEVCPCPPADAYEYYDYDLPQEYDVPEQPSDLQPGYPPGPPVPIPSAAARELLIPISASDTKPLTAAPQPAFPIIQPHRVPDFDNKNTVRIPKVWSPRPRGDN